MLKWLFRAIDEVARCYYYSRTQAMKVRWTREAEEAARRASAGIATFGSVRNTRGSSLATFEDATVTEEAGREGQPR